MRHKMITALALTIVCGIAVGVELPVSNSASINVPSVMATQVAPSLTDSCKILDFGSQLPQFGIYLSNASNLPADITTVTLAGYVDGSETGSTQVDIGEILTPGQNLDIWINLPPTWYTTITYPELQPDIYTAIPTTCEVLWYS